MIRKNISLALIAGIIFSTTLQASSEVSTEDIAKAVEILILDLKNQKNVSNERANKLNALELEISEVKTSAQKVDKLESSIDELNEKNRILTKKLEAVSVRPQKAVIVTQVDDTSKAKGHTLDNGVIGRYKVAASHSLNAHKSSKIDSQVVNWLNKDEVVIAIKEDNGFVLTPKGWVQKKYLQTLEERKNEK